VASDPRVVDEDLEAAVGRDRRLQTPASVRSPAMATARPPPARMSWAAASSSEAVRATRVTPAPAPPSANATARPMPRPAPVTRAEDPRTCMSRRV